MPLNISHDCAYKTMIVEYLSNNWPQTFNGYSTLNNPCVGLENPELGLGFLHTEESSFKYTEPSPEFKV